MATVLLQNRELYAEMSARITPSGHIFDDVIQCGLSNPSLSGVGAVFTEKKCYITFKKFYDQLIQTQHGKVYRNQN